MSRVQRAVWAGVLAACAVALPAPAVGQKAKGAKSKPTATGAVPARPAPPVPGAGETGAADAGMYRPARPAFRWEFPTVLSEVEVPEVFETNGIPTRFRALVLALPFERAYVHFRESFTRQGLYVAPPKEQLQMAPGQVSLTGLDPEGEVTYTVIFTPYDDGTTGAIVGEAWFKGRELAASNPFVPVMSGGEGLVTQQLETGRTVAYTVRATQAAVMTFYGQVLRDRGYTQQKDGAWTRGTSAIRVVADESAKGPDKVDVGVVEFSTPADEP
ncbi:MAG: hypothetical protein FJ086_09500 [Deltaproteobacteria bacterium]|nr:hypothetical protein [Deltaproteobacteria bacterium]